MGLVKPNIEKMRAKNDVKGLIKALNSNGLQLLKSAEEALEDIGHRTIEPFIEALRDKDAGVRSGAAWILGNIRDAGAQKPLIEALKDKDKNVRWLAVADTYDAMTSERPYRKAMDAEVACTEIERCKGTQFDPEVVGCLFQNSKVQPLLLGVIAPRA